MKQKHLVWPILLAMSLMLACKRIRDAALYTIIHPFTFAA